MVDGGPHAALSTCTLRCGRHALLTTAALGWKNLVVSAAVDLFAQRKKWTAQRWTSRSNSEEAIIPSKANHPSKTETYGIPEQLR